MEKISLYKKGIITQKQLFILYIVEELKSVKIEELLISFNELFSMEDLEKLEKLEIVNVDYSKNMIELKQKSLSVKDVDKIRVILNRELKNYELEQVKNWYKDYSIKEIEEAVYQTVLKGIDNFNYIEKVLFNKAENQDNKQEKGNLNGNSKVIKKFDLFT